jgi:hypothetical protein
VEGLCWVDTKMCVVGCCALVIWLTNMGDGMLEWVWKGEQGGGREGKEKKEGREIECIWTNYLIE